MQGTNKIEKTVTQHLPRISSTLLHDFDAALWRDAWVVAASE
jgi:hypothetical protein